MQNAKYDAREALVNTVDETTSSSVLSGSLLTTAGCCILYQQLWITVPCIQIAVPRCSVRPYLNLVIAAATRREFVDTNRRLQM